MLLMGEVTAFALFAAVSGQLTDIAKPIQPWVLIQRTEAHHDGPTLLGFKLTTGECPPLQPDKTRPPSPSFSTVRAQLPQRWPLLPDRED